MDVAADREARALLLDRLEQRPAAEVHAGAVGVAVALRRRVQDEDGALGAGGEHRGRGLLVEVEAPVPGVTGTPAPRPKNCAPAISAPSPCSTVAASQAAAASRRASSVSLLPGTRTVGASIAARAPIVSSRPSWTEAKSPAPITTSASADISTSTAACPRSRCRSLKARIFTPKTYRSPPMGLKLIGVPRAVSIVSPPLMPPVFWIGLGIAGFGASSALLAGAKSRSTRTLTGLGIGAYLGVMAAFRSRPRSGDELSRRPHRLRRLTVLTPRRGGDLRGFAA